MKAWIEDRQRANDQQWTWLVTRMAERWPAWNPSSVVRSDWMAELGSEPVAALEIALRRTRANYASDTPKLRWVLSFLLAQREKREKVSQKHTQLEPWQVLAHPDTEAAYKREMSDIRRRVGMLSSEQRQAAADALRSHPMFKTVYARQDLEKPWEAWSDVLCGWVLAKAELIAGVCSDP